MLIRKKTLYIQPELFLKQLGSLLKDLKPSNSVRIYFSTLESGQVTN